METVGNALVILHQGHVFSEKILLFGGKHSL